MPTPADTRRRAIIWACGGLLAMFLMLFLGGEDRHTLLEAEVPGSIGLPNDGTLKRTKIPFVVEHPGVSHKIVIWPREGGSAAPAKGTFGDVSFVVEVLGADASQIYSDRVAAKNDKAGETSFTPTQAGRHTLTIAVTAPNIPKIHVLISDPMKKNGKRMKGN